jgi:hypothetical protein
LDAAGSSAALATAKSVFAWYGVDHDYPSDSSFGSVDPDHPDIFTLLERAKAGA